MKIIPAIDIINGQCVRLSEGDYDTKKVYYTEPLEAAKAFESAGLEFLHLVDLDGAKAKEVQNWKVLETIASNTNLKIDFSGGISDKAQAKKAFDLGANQITIGSLAVKQPETVKAWLEEFESDKLIIGADVKDEKIAIHGWQETSELSIFEFIEDYIKSDAIHFLCTDVAKDGRLKGPSIDLYKKIIKLFPSIQLIASGGVANKNDLVELKAINCTSAIVGKAIYENRITLTELTAI